MHTAKGGGKAAAELTDRVLWSTAHTGVRHRAVLAKRSPGSAFKPVVYLAALDSGMVSPSTELIDEEVVFEVAGQEFASF